MAHFAELDDTGVVLRVLVISNDQEHRGEAFLAEDCRLGGRWLQTSYTSQGGKRINPETGEEVSSDHFRYNFAGIGYSYDEALDAFIPPKPFDSWLLDEETCTWVAPIPAPNPVYVWDEELGDWIDPEA